ncbi:MAG: hypothetical protein KME31_08330 [Tolypothrix carrinoi HA7290-LM1]|nr:hypothetical protein [Tolypothrix carrinoi HA7290-LM1]
MPIEKVLTIFFISDRLPVWQKKQRSTSVVSRRKLLIITWALGIGHWALGIGNRKKLSPLSPCLPMPHSPCPIPHAPCPMPHSLFF